MSDLPTAFHDLRPEDFPLLIEFYNDEGMLLDHIEVNGPGVVKVPGFGSMNMAPVHVQSTYPDGRRVVMLATGERKDTTKAEFSLSGYLAGRAAGRRAIIPPRDDWSAAPPGYYDE